MQSPTPPSTWIRRLGLGGLLLFATAAMAVPGLVGKLAPPSDLAVPGPGTEAQKVRSTAKESSGQACAASLPRLAKVPFGPGEVLEFEAGVLGYDVAVFETRVEPYTMLDGRRVLPIYAEVHTDFLMRVAAGLDGEMRTWLDPQTLTPRRHAWRMRATSPKIDFYARNDVAFAADGKVAVRMHSVTKEFGKDAEESKEEGVVSSMPGVLDFLSVVYDARVRQLKVGSVLCSPVQFASGMGPMRGEVIAREEVDVDYDERMAFKIHVTDGNGSTKDFTAHAWISDDAERLPLRLLIENKHGAFDLELDDVDR